MMNKRRFKRRKYFLRDSSQLRLMAKVYIILLAVMFISGGLFYFIGNKELGDSYFEAHSRIKSTMEILLPGIIVVNLIALFLAVFLALFFTHSIAGPLYRLRRMAKVIGDGDLSMRIKFRDKDEVKEAAEAVNQIVEGLHLRITKFKEISTKLSSAISLLEGEKLSESDIAEVAGELVKVSQELKGELSRVKL